MDAHVLLIDTGDFLTFPIGGQLTFARHMMSTFGSRLALVGFATENDVPIGCWTKRYFCDGPFQYFAYMRLDPTQYFKPIIPFRLQVFLNLRKHMRAIRSTGIRNVFVQCPECLMAINSYHWNSVCFRFPGVQDELRYSRYRWAWLLRKPFNAFLFRCAAKANVLLASASTQAIQEVATRNGGRLASRKMIHFPTRVDTRFFCPGEKVNAREKLGQHTTTSEMLLVSTTRLAWSKGWKLLLDVLAVLLHQGNEVKLALIGDGEDRSKVQDYASELGLINHLVLTGAMQKSSLKVWLQASDVYVVGAYREGWSNAMLEALACGKPIVSTDVSGAHDMIKTGQNGYIVDSRNAQEFAGAILKAKELSNASLISCEIASRFSLMTLHKDLATTWGPLSI